MPITPTTSLGCPHPDAPSAHWFDRDARRAAVQRHPFTEAQGDEDGLSRRNSWEHRRIRLAEDRRGSGEEADSELDETKATRAPSQAVRFSNNDSTNVKTHVARSPRSQGPLRREKISSCRWGFGLVVCLLTIMILLSRFQESQKRQVARPRSLHLTQHLQKVDSFLPRTIAKPEYWQEHESPDDAISRVRSNLSLLSSLVADFEHAILYEWVEEVKTSFQHERCYEALEIASVIQKTILEMSPSQKVLFESCIVSERLFKLSETNLETRLGNADEVYMGHVAKGSTVFDAQRVQQSRRDRQHRDLWKSHAAGLSEEAHTACEMIKNLMQPFERLRKILQLLVNEMDGGAYGCRLPSVALFEKVFRRGVADLVPPTPENSDVRESYLRFYDALG